MATSSPGRPSAHATPAPVPVRRPLDLARTGPWFAGLLLVALVAFWPTYLSRMGESGAYTHLHAATATLWMVLLVVQPVLIARRRLELHRRLGQLSWLLGPLVVISAVMLANANLQGVSGEAFPVRAYVLYLQLSLAGLFGLCWAAAMVTRRTMALHARFMIATSFALIDPVTIRLVLQLFPDATWNGQWVTFALTDAVILALIWLERDAKRGRWVFPALLVIFVLAQIPALSGMTFAEPWLDFAAWFQGMPLS